MIDINMKLPTDVTDALREELHKAPALVKGGIQRLANQSRQRTLNRLIEEPGAVKRPIRWKSEKQRKAFFATDGFGRGIPTKRTGALQAGWEVEINLTDEGGEISLGNTTSYARFVQGDDAQPFHLDTGWSQAAPIATEEFDILEDNMVELWFLIVDPNEAIR